jgi:hypothetical protein
MKMMRLLMVVFVCSAMLALWGCPAEQAEETVTMDQTSPGDTTVAFTPEQPGEYHFHCTVYCGPGHDEMHGTRFVRE